MKVTSERLPDAEVRLTIEATDEEMAASREQAYRSLAAHAAVPGFRPGKAPRPMIERALGPERILSEALEQMLPRMYRDAILQEGLKPYDQGELEIQQRDPVIFKARVPLMPTVTLGDYRAIRLDREPVAVTDDEVESQLADIREEQAQWVPVEARRTVQLGDRAVVDLVASVGEDKFLDRKGLEVEISEERGLIIPGLATEVVGTELDHERRVTMALPETFSLEHLRGKEAEFVLTVHEIKEKKLPELDDDFAKTSGVAETLGELRDRIRFQISGHKAAEAQDRYENALLDAVAAVSQIEYPAAVVSEELDVLADRQADRIRQRGVDLDTYLRIVGKSREDFRSELEPQARQRIRTSLLLGQLSVAEDIHVDAGEIDAEVERLVSQAGDGSSDVCKALSTERGRQNVANLLLERKTLARLVQIASGKAPEMGPVVSGDAGAVTEPA